MQQEIWYQLLLRIRITSFKSKTLHCTGTLVTTRNGDMNREMELVKVVYLHRVFTRS